MDDFALARPTEPDKQAADKRDRLSDRTIRENERVTSPFILPCARAHNEVIKAIFHTQYLDAHLREAEGHIHFLIL